MVSSVRMALTDVHRTIEAVWRIEAARLIAALSRRVRDVGLAEELAQDALVSALEQWPRERRPGQPGRLAHDDAPATAPSTCSVAAQGARGQVRAGRARA